MNADPAHPDAAKSESKSVDVPASPVPQLVDRVARKEQRKLQARRETGRGIWYGLGMFGLVGWSIAVPTVAGTALGVWIDRTWHPEYSCTLMGLFIGVVTGCWIAWYWIERESLLPTDFPAQSGNAVPEKRTGHADAHQAQSSEARGATTRDS